MILSDLVMLGPLSLHDHVEFLRRNIRYYERYRSLSSPDFDLSKLPHNPDMDAITKAWLAEFQSFAFQVAELRFSGLQGEAFKLITSITKYDQYSKRDGSIISVIRQGDTVVTDEQEVHSLIIQGLTNKDNELSALFNPRSPPIPKRLPSITWQEVKRLISRLSVGKALSVFPIPDNFLKEIAKSDGDYNFDDLWDAKFLLEHPELLQAKLIPLNKTHPRVPRSDQMRPIVVSNPLLKLAEARFTQKLNEFFLKLPPLSCAQIGFLAGMTTQVNIYRLCSSLTEPYERGPRNTFIPKSDHPSNLKSFVVYIDYTAAYNSIRMDKLRDRMLDLTHSFDMGLTPDEINYIFWLYSQLYVSLGSSSYRPKFGVPQGGLNSPILFNISMYFMTQDFSQSLADSITDETHTHIPFDPMASYLFADDAAYRFHIAGDLIHCKKVLRHFLRHLNAVSKEWGLFINWAKSAIQWMFFSPNRHKGKIIDLSDQVVDQDLMLTLNLSLDPSTQEYVKIPLVKTYKYLGIQISWNLTLEQHLKYLRPKIRYLVNSFLSIRKASQSMKFCFNTWEVFVRPLLDYAATYAYFCGQSNSAKALQALYRSSVRDMMSLRSYTPTTFIDCLIQYNYAELPKKFIEVASEKWEARLEGLKDGSKVFRKVDYAYTRIHVEYLPHNFPKLYNLLYLVETHPDNSNKCKRQVSGCKDRLYTRLHILDVHEGKNVRAQLDAYLKNLCEEKFFEFCKFVDDTYDCAQQIVLHLEDSL